MKKVIFILLVVVWTNNLFAQWQPTGGSNISSAINCFAISGTYILAGSADGIYISNNSGGCFILENTGLTNININALTINGTIFFAGTDNGIFISSDSG